jgi:signal peptidase I
MRLSRILKLAGYAVTILLVGVAVFAIAEYASGTQPFYVISDNPSSMSPTINYGWVVVVYKAPFSSISAGDIIAFHDPRGNPDIIIHRVVSVTECGTTTCLTTKGDNNATNPTPDPWVVTGQDYVGKVVLVIPFAGYLSPALWGFKGLSVYLPISFVVLLLAFVSIARTKPGEGPSKVKEREVD